VLTERASVIVPPFGRERFERELASLPAQVRGAFPWRRLLDQLFEPVPLVTQGFYAFESEVALARFERSLGPEYAQACEELRAVFDSALDPERPPGTRPWQALDRLSQKVMDLQKARVEEALEHAPAPCRAPATRVRLDCDEGGRLEPTAVHYALEFSPELERCSRLLRDAHDCVPAFAIELRGVLSDLAAWCLDRSCDDAWAVSLPRWIGAQDTDNLLDVNLTFEEKVSRVGSKGGLQLIACAFDSVPGPLEATYGAIREEARRRQNLNILFLRQLVVGGGASNYTLAGEKLPDPDGYDQYKVMIFTNTTRTALVQGNTPLILSATEWPEREIDMLADSAALFVLFHEYGHTLGDYGEFLGDLGGSVEETNAEASAVYQTARLAPEHLERALVLGACWTPVRRTLQGPTESHSHADIALFGEYHAAGAVKVARVGDRNVVRVLRPDAIVRTAFATALRMRLWEAGIPMAQQAQLLEPFDVVDRAQDERIANGARRHVGALREATRASLRRKVLDEVRAYFAIERLERVAEPLRGVIATMPGFQSIALVPTDRRFGPLLGP
jgi:hypothetical protein